LAAQRPDRHVHPEQAAQLGGPGASRVDDNVGLNFASRRANRCDSVCLPRKAADLDVGQAACALSTGATDVSSHDTVRVGEAVTAVKRCREDVVQPEEGKPPPSFTWGEPLRVHAEAVL